MEQITDVKTTEMNLMPSAGSKRYWWKAIASFLMVLFTMPLGHALMIIMEHVMNETVLHYSAFAMGAVGMVMVIIGVFAQGDTRQTLWGLFVQYEEWLQFHQLVAAFVIARTKSRYSGTSHDTPCVDHHLYGTDDDPMDFLSCADVLL